MNISEILQALGNSAIGQYIAVSAWAFPVLESIHVVALALVFGIIFIVDLRLLGVASTSRRVSEVSRDSLYLVWAAFIIAAISGALLFSSNPVTYFDNEWFRWKMLFLVLAGINMAIFELITARSMDEWDDGSVAVPPAGKIAGLFSIAFWAIVITCGRMIGFTLYALPF